MDSFRGKQKKPTPSPLAALPSCIQRQTGPSFLSLPTVGGLHLAKPPSPPLPQVEAFRIRALALHSGLPPTALLDLQALMWAQPGSAEAWVHHKICKTTSIKTALCRLEEAALRLFDGAGGEEILATAMAVSLECGKLFMPLARTEGWVIARELKESPPVPVSWEEDEKNNRFAALVVSRLQEMGFSLPKAALDAVSTAKLHDKAWDPVRDSLLVKDLENVAIGAAEADALSPMLQAVVWAVMNEGMTPSGQGLLFSHPTVHSILGSCLPRALLQGDLSERGRHGDDDSFIIKRHGDDDSFIIKRRGLSRGAKLSTCLMPFSSSEQVNHLPRWWQGCC